MFSFKLEKIKVSTKKSQMAEEALIFCALRISKHP